MATDVPPGGGVVTVGVGLRGNWVPAPGPEKGGGAEPVRPGPAREGSGARLKAGGPRLLGRQSSAPGRESGFVSPALGPAGRLGVTAQSGNARCHPAYSLLPEP